MKLYVVVVEGNSRYGEEVIGVFKDKALAEHQIGLLNFVDYISDRDRYIEEFELDKLSYT